MGAIILGPRIGMKSKLGGRIFPTVETFKTVFRRKDTDRSPTAAPEEDTEFRGHSVPVCTTTVG